MKNSIRTVVYFLVAALSAGCSTFGNEKSAEVWRDHYCLQNPQDRAACETRTPPHYGADTPR